ncbi:isoleucine--tRNA ligase [Candidatus Daviesbacteria bacterium]|nr:isoleucine--tRNA ligase [Candidatus Daviesbacteria bacterium]
MVRFKPVLSTVDFFEIEEQLIKYWEDNKIFERSINERPEDRKWTFLDGPPFVTGTPHFGSLLSSIPKDVFGRYFTMKGYRVRRVWGWDGHGLPIENKVEQELRLKSKKDIEEKVGVDRFIKECLKYVQDVSADWEWYIKHIGRWVDFKNAYKTWDLPYMESVMWVFKQIYDKGLVYKGLRVSLYCPHCATPISNFEVAMDADNYKDVTEASNVYKYPLKDQQNTFLLAWSTTPWNKIVTPALAVNPKLTYVKVKQGDENYILAKTTLKMLKEEPKIEVLEEFKGSELIGKKFIPHYDFYPINPGKLAFVVVGGDFVSDEEGTGIVTLAAYGEEDLEIMKKENIQIVLHVDDEGIILDSVPKFGGMYYLKANELVNKDLADRGLLYDEKQLSHSVAHCWRCATRLFYAPKDAWYIDVQKIKPQLFKNNEPINFFPKHFKMGRFKKSMEAAPDWNISRNRYWGSPVPVWECECGERFVPGGVKELEEKSGQEVSNLHKPFIDEVKITCKSCGKKVARVPEVLDSWIEAGSASFAERHFPFEKDLKLEDFFPPDFIAEYTGQIRAWFYVLHVIGTALFNSPAFKNVLVEGVMLGTDGRKMSKNYGNFPDPKEIMTQYGGDALRLYLLGSPVMKGEDVNFSSDGVPQVSRGFLLILWNCYKYFVDYANTFDFSYTSSEDLTILDKWILARLTQVVLDIKNSYENYDTSAAVKLLKEFIVNDLSTWYIRRSRGRKEALNILYDCLITLTKLLAPLAPFISEEIFKNLTGEESVHLQQFPRGDQKLLDNRVIREMRLVREIGEKAHALRKEANIKLRQPLASLTYAMDHQLDKDLEQILAEELNVKKIEYKQSSESEPKVELNTNITLELKEEGEVRDLIRQIQQLRKNQNLTLADKTKIIAPSWSKDFEEQILKSTTSTSIVKGGQLEIVKAENEVSKGS